VPILASGGKQTIFGALERRRAVGEILAMGRKYGAASNFLTISIDDVNTPNVFRMGFRSCNNINFPSHCPDSLLNAMEVGNNFVADGCGCIHGEQCLGHGEIHIPCNWSALARRATENPVSVALHYNKIIHGPDSLVSTVSTAMTAGFSRPPYHHQAIDCKSLRPLSPCQHYLRHCSESSKVRKYEFTY
jgi:hypothetical protein